LAFAVAFGFNFTVSRSWTFEAAGKEGKTHQQLFRYGVLVGVNLALTLVIVAGFAAIGVNFLIAKVVAGVINAVGNFLAYRHWVFAIPPII